MFGDGVKSPQHLCFQRCVDPKDVRRSIVAEGAAGALAASWLASVSLGALASSWWEPSGDRRSLFFSSDILHVFLRFGMIV